MRNRVWWLVSLVPAALLLSGCAYEMERQRAQSQHSEALAELAPLNGYNTVYIVFWVCLAVVLVIGSLAYAFMKIRVARHESYAQIQIAREKTHRDRLHGGQSRVEAD